MTFRGLWWVGGRGKGRRVAALGGWSLSLSMLAAAFALPGFGQGAPPQKVLGTVAAVSGDSVTVRQEGGETTVALTPATRLLRTVPGSTSLKDAQPMAASDLAVGDRVLIRPAADGSAGVLVAMKSGDIAEKHQQESADWQRRGVAGIVESVVAGQDPGAGTITLKGAGAAGPVVVHTTGATAVRRYAPDSTSFADTVKGTLAEIHAGDQLRARGARDEGGAVTAEEIVAGSFRDVTGTVIGVDAAAGTLTLMNVASRKPETLVLEPSAQLRKLPPEMAARLAHPGGGGPNTGGHAPDGAAAPEQPHAGGSDLLQHAPSITLADLHKGDAVMVVASGPGAARPTAITVVAGVEPLLRASPEASAGLFSSSWNLGSGGAAEGGAPQ